MTLSDEQFEFGKDLALLVLYISAIGQKCTIGEVQRTEAQQKLYVEAGKSWTMNSKHLKKLAADLNIWIDGVYIGALPASKAAELAEPIGAYWESLRPANTWGGRWSGRHKDVPHFQRGK